MRTQIQPVRDPDLGRFEAELSARLESLFRQCPSLCGFAVRADGAVSELTCHPAAYGELAQNIGETIAGVLTELADERPEAAPRLLGRTFARTMH